jgi:hypothetical protein
VKGIYELGLRIQKVIMKIVGEDVVGLAESEKYFFEGTEKLLEIWFDCSNGSESADLRVIDR